MAGKNPIGYPGDEPEEESTPMLRRLKNYVFGREKTPAAQPSPSPAPDPKDKKE